MRMKKGAVRNACGTEKGGVSEWVMVVCLGRGLAVAGRQWPGLGLQGLSVAQHFL
jgi:hypothetical protein